MTPIIMTADDYAQSAEIDHGILALIAMGRLTATSCLVLSPRWPQAAQQLTSQIRQSADIGLHLDFTQFTHELAHSLGALIVKSTFRMLPNAKVKRVIQRQLDIFEDALGTPPDYVDGHQHVHQLPQIRDALMDELTRRYGSHGPWIRIARPPLSDGFKGMVIKALGAASIEQLAVDKNLLNTKTLMGVYGFNLTADLYRQHLANWMGMAKSLPGPIALMCHPACGVSTTDPLDDPIFAARRTEYEVLASAQFSALLDQARVSLVRGNHFKSA